MDSDTKDELRGLVVGFLTSALKENPQGFELGQFERLFPEKVDEPHDWYKQYKMPNTLAALKNLDDSIRIQTNGRGTYISLNTRSDKVDRHLVDLVQNQKSSGKRKRLPARSSSQRVKDSFSINLRASNNLNRGSSGGSGFGGFGGRYRTRINNENSYPKNHIQHVDRNVPTIYPPRQTIYKETKAAAPGDPRARQISSQVRPFPSSYPSGPPPTKQSSYGNGTPHQRRQTIQVNSSPSITSTTPTSRTSIDPRTSAVPAALQPREQRSKATLPQQPPLDPEIEARRCQVKQRLLYLLNNKLPEIRVLYLPYLYESQYDEPLDPAKLGYKSLTHLYLSFSDVIRVSYKSASPTISAIVGETRGKENIASKNGNSRSANNHSKSGNASCETTIDNKENSMPEGRARFNAIDPFNVTTMLQSLEPLRKGPEPIPIGNSKLEDIVKYRTLRIIFKDPQMTLRFEDWDRKYQQEWNCSTRLRLRDYGYKNHLEFFKSLQKELPFKIQLKDDDFVAKITDLKDLSTWLRQQVADGNYKAVTTIDAKYEHIATPGDKFSYWDYESLQQQPYYPAIKMAVEPAYKLCRDMPDRVEDYITFETCSACYDDYKRKDFFKVPEGFIVNGFPCAAFDQSEQQWCRAIILDTPETKTKDTKIWAFLVDYATSKSFMISDLLCILKNHLKYPVKQLQPILN